jgi:hypothetical protein
MNLVEVAKATKEEYQKKCVKVEQDMQKSLFSYLEALVLSPEVKQRGQYGDPVVEFEFPPITLVCRKVHREDGVFFYKMRVINDFFDPRVESDEYRTTEHNVERVASLFKRTYPNRIREHVENFLRELGFQQDCGNWVLDLREAGVDIQLFAEITMFPNIQQKVRSLTVTTTTGKKFKCPLLREKNLEEFGQQLEKFVKEETLRLLKGEE